MPHFIAEYTDNIEQQADLPGLFEKVHALLGDSGVFPWAASAAVACAWTPGAWPTASTTTPSCT